MKKEKIRIKRKKSSVINFSIVIIIFIIVLVSLTTAYSLLSSNLTIVGTVEGKEPVLPVTPVKPDESSDRYSTNTTIEANWMGFTQETLKVVGDTVEGNVITTKLANAGTTIFERTVKATFTLTIQNNSDETYTDGTITYEENDTGNKMELTSQTLSATTLTSGSTTTLTCVVTFSGTNSSVPVGSYILYKIAFNSSSGQTKYYYYKILISE